MEDLLDIDFKEVSLFVFKTCLILHLLEMLGNY